MPEPSLTRYDAQPGPEGLPLGVTLMLHGGKQHSHRAVTRHSASWRRSLAMQREIAQPSAAVSP